MTHHHLSWLTGVATAFHPSQLNPVLFLLPPWWESFRYPIIESTWLTENIWPRTKPCFLKHSSKSWYKTISYNTFLPRPHPHPMVPYGLFSSLFPWVHKINCIHMQVDFVQMVSTRSNWGNILAKIRDRKVKDNLSPMKILMYIFCNVKDGVEANWQ